MSDARTHATAATVGGGVRLTRKRICFAVVLVGLLILSLFIVTTGNLFSNQKSFLWAHHSSGTINSISITQTGSLIALGVGFTGTKGAVILLDGTGNVIWEHQTDRIISHVSISSNGSRIEADGYQLIGGGSGGYGGGPAQFYANSEVYAFDYKGNLLWSRAFPGSPLYGVMSRDGSRIAISSPGLVNYLAWDGKSLWNYTVPGAYPSAFLSQNGSRVAISVSNPSNVTMLNSDGKALWTFRDTALAATSSDGVFTTRGDRAAVCSTVGLTSYPINHTFTYSGFWLPVPGMNYSFKTFTPGQYTVSFNDTSGQRELHCFLVNPLDPTKSFEVSNTSETARLFLWIELYTP